MLKYSFATFVVTIAIFLSFSNLFATQDSMWVRSDSIRIYKTKTVNVSSSVAKHRVSPVPFSEINQMEIEQRSSNLDLPLLLNTMSSVLSYSENGNGVGYSNLNIRGFDQRRISVYVNGIPQNDPEDHNMYWINLSDIYESVSSIQVQRGAGFSNYGSAAMAGSVNLTTSNFSNKPAIKFETGAGFQEFDYKNKVLANTSKFKVEIQSGIVDNKYSFYGKLSRLNSIGYRDQSGGQFSSWFLGATRYDKNITTQINIFGGSQDDGLAYNGIPKFLVKNDELRVKNYSYFEQYGKDKDGEEQYWGADRRKRAVEKFNQPHYEMLNDWYISDNLTFKSSLFYYEGAGYFDYSGAGWTSNSNFGLSDTLTEIGNTLIRGFVSNKQGGWIPRLVWKHNKGVLTTGAEFRIHRSDHWSKIEFAENLPIDFDQDYKFSSYNGERDIFSFFAREQYNLTDKVLINIEGQLVYNRYGLNNISLGGKKTEFIDTKGNILNSNGVDLFNYTYLFFNPRLGINYNYTDEMNFYAFVAMTSREPRMKFLFNASENWNGETPLFESTTDSLGTRYDFEKPYIKPETMIDYELGWNYIDGRNQANINIYYMDYQNEFVKSGQLDIYGTPIIANSNSTQHIGLELSGQYNIFNGISAFANITYSSNIILDMNYIAKYDDERDSTIIKRISLNRNKIAGFSDILSSFGVSYSKKSLNISVFGKYVGEFRTDNFGDLLKTNEDISASLGSGWYDDNVVDAYLVINANASFNLKDVLHGFDVNLKLFINNLLDNKYASYGAGNQFFVGAERNYYLGIEYKM